MIAATHRVDVPVKPVTGSAASPASAVRPGTATLVLIASAGHSGSTLLDVLLANHSQVSSAGEMNRLTLHAPDRVCACGATVTHCEFWNGVRRTIGERRREGASLRWEQCHTDIPPQKPLLQMAMAADTTLVDGGPVPGQVQRAMRAAGLAIGDDAVLTRSGVRDFKWRISEPGHAQHHVLRVVDGRLDVYDEAVTWKNPIRLVPHPIELALALGNRLSLNVVRSLSPTAQRYMTIAENSWAVADAMAAVSGTPYVVDSSKSPSRLKLLYSLRPEHVRIIELVRDGRAVTASAMRRSRISATRAARIWKRDNQNLAVMLRTVPARLKLRVKYEEVCESPQRELQRVCGFLGVPFEPSMAALWERPVHNIPGNPMLFNRTRRTISHDDRWQRDLSAADLAAFNQVAGRLNRRFGYQ